MLLCSADIFGNQGNADSDTPSISADGRWVAFTSDASNLVAGAGDTNATGDVFVKDMESGALVRCSTTAAGAQVPQESALPSISSEGRYVAFESDAALVASDTNGFRDIYRKDLQTGAVARCSVTAGGTQGDAGCRFAALSADGRCVAFETTATNLASGDTNSVADIYWKNTATGALHRCSVSSGGVRADTDSHNPGISADGTFVVFQSNATNLIAGNSNTAGDIFRRNTTSGQTVRCSLSGAGGQSDGQSNFPSVSDDGRFVSFASMATNLVAGDTNGFFDVFRKDMVTAGVIRCSVGPNGMQSNNNSLGITSMTPDGSYVAFSSVASNLVGYDLGGVRDVFATPVGSLWYFAEGYTGNGFQEYLTLGNAGADAVISSINYIFNNGTAQQSEVTVPAGSRATVNLNSEVGAGRDVSCKVVAPLPLVVESPMYFNYGGYASGGHTVLGATQPAGNWFFAEGYTGPGFEEFVTVFNPQDRAAHLGFHFQTEEVGPVDVMGITVPAHARTTFRINDLLGEGYQASLRREADQFIVAERPMYFDYRGLDGHHWEGGHCIMGATALTQTCNFAEGTTRAGFDEWLTISNPFGAAVQVNAVYQLGPGQGAPIPKTYNVNAGRRLTIYVPSEVGVDKDVSVRLTSTGFSWRSGPCTSATRATEPPGKGAMWLSARRSWAMNGISPRAIRVRGSTSTSACRTRSR